MCLLSKTKHLEKAPCDIAVYKVLCKNGLLYETPFTNTPIPTLEINGAAPFKAMGDIDIVYSDTISAFLLEKGLIHVCTDIWSALSTTSINGLKNYDIFRCIIPKDTLYIQGLNQDCGAKEIVFKKKVSKFWLGVCKMFI